MNVGFESIEDRLGHVDQTSGQIMNLLTQSQSSIEALQVCISIFLHSLLFPSRCCVEKKFDQKK